MSDNQEHEVLKTESTYEIPCNEIKSREDVYEFFNDAILSLNEAYQYAQKELPALPKIIFPTLPIKNYQREIDGVLYILDSQN